MATVATLEVELNGRDTNVDAMLARVDARLLTTDVGAQRTAATFSSTLPSAMQATATGAASVESSAAGMVAAMRAAGAAAGQSETEFLAEAGALSQLALASGDAAGAEAILAAALGKTTAAAEAQAPAVATDTAALGGMEAAASGASTVMSGLGIAMGGVFAAKLAADLVVTGAEAQRTAARFDSLAASAHTTGAALLAVLRSASGGEIADSALQLDTMKASLLGVGNSAAVLAPLMTLARDRAQQMGISTEQAFDRLVTGLGRSSPKILDDLGIMVNVTQVNAAYAASLGKTADQLSIAEKKQGLINEVMRQGAATAAASGAAIEGNAASVQRLGASFQNLKEGIGGNLANAIAPTINSLSDLSQGFQGNATEVAATIQGYANFISILTSSSAAGAAQQESNRGMIASFLELIGVSSGVAQAQAQVVAATTIGATVSQQAAAAALGYADSLALVSVQARAAAVAAENKSNADQLASVNASTHTVALNTLAQQAQIAAAALLASGGSGASAAAALAGSSSQVDVLTAAYYRLAAAQAAAGVAATKAALGRQTARQLTGADSEQAGIRANQRAAVAQDRAQRVKASSDAARAEESYQLTLKNTAPALAHARAELAQLTVGSAAYINKQNDIAKLQQQTEKNAKSSAGGGGPKLTAQEKLNNALLTNQETFDTKAEDAERDHVDRIVAINEEFAKRMREAQDRLGQSQLDSRAGFYDSLGSIEDAGLRNALAAQYEAAFQEADQIAKDKGADVGQKFLEARQSAIEAQGKRASEIAQATKEGDKDKAAYLAGVDKLYRAAEERRVAAIAAGADSATAQRDAQLAEEGAKYADAQDQIGAKADQAAERKILAAERAGQAVDAEGLKVDTLTKKYDGLGAAGARAGITPAATAQATATGEQAAPTAAPAAADPIASLRDAIGAVERAIGAVERATRDAGRGVESAVRSIPRSVA